MPGSQLRRWVLRYHLSRIERIGDNGTENKLRLRAIVFSPHQDDETLGCGGTIVKKRVSGADMNVVFMTDGCRSHPRLIKEVELKSVRRDEALAATQTLGIDASDVVFLDFKDGTLNKNLLEAIDKVKTLILEYRPEEIFIPYARDGVADHIATHRIVTRALDTLKVNVIVNEYPIWFWNHWPWVNFTDSKKNEFSSFANIYKSALTNLSLSRYFRFPIHVKDTLEVKRTALNQYKSQMTRLVSTPAWKTLSDVSNGEFLECFFQDYELFYRYKSANKDGS